MTSPVRERPDAIVSPPDLEALSRRVVDLTREHDAALADRAAERERAAALLIQCDRLAEEIFAWRRRHADEAAQHARAADQVRQLTAQLAHARATIANMERSLFWRARLLWLRIRGLSTF